MQKKNSCLPGEVFRAPPTLTGSYGGHGGAEDSPVRPWKAWKTRR